MKMIDYTSEDQIMQLTNYRNAQSLVLVGIVVWEILITLPFDWSLASGKRRARWPIIAYVIARASMVLHVLALTIDSHGRDIISCDTQTWILQITGATGIWASSLLFALRTIAVWSWDRKVIAFVAVLYAGLVVVHCMTWQKPATLFNGLGSVVLKSPPHTTLLIESTYTMIFNFLVTLLAVVKLGAWRKEGGLSQMMLENGIFYFIFASGGHLVQAVLAALSLSGLLNVLFLPVAMCISVIASTRVFIRFITHTDPHNTYTPQKDNSHSVRTTSTPDDYQSPRLGQESQHPPTNATQTTSMLSVTQGSGQPYGLNTVKEPSYCITIQTHTAMVEARNLAPDLEYGRKRETEDNDQFNWRSDPAR